MLQLKNISRVYKTDDIELKALDGVSISFRRSEFVSILGPSGSGKTTLLNIIGGLDHYTSGDIIIDGVSTKKYTDRDWDAYRNHRIGFVFQSYNLIGHQTILSNVELALTLSGVSGSRKRELATEALKKVGLGSHLSKRPSQLSGGQMQRVAIARALVNNPDIILADEPTGALDSKTSIQIMDLLKEIAKDRLVVMVTHNPDLAKAYSTRIVNVKDGQVISDTKPYDGKADDEKAEKPKYTSLKLLTALQLSKNNLMTKRGRTVLTAIAGSIGIIGIALVLALANGVNNYAESLLTQGSLASAITVNNTYTESDSSTFTMADTSKGTKHDGTVLALDDLTSNLTVTHQRTVRQNDLKGLKTYLDAHAEEMASYTELVNYDYKIELSVYDGATKINPVDGAKDPLSSLLGLGGSEDSSEIKASDLLESGFKEVISNKTLDLLEGKLPEKTGDLILVTDESAEISLSLAYSLGLASREELDSAIADMNSGKTHTFETKSFKFSDIIGHKYRAEFKNGSSETLTVVGVAKVKDSADPKAYMGYTHALTEVAVKSSAGAYDITTPQMVSIYPKSEADKPQITALLDKFAEEKGTKLVYSDSTQLAVDAVKTIVNILSYVLIAFVAISLVVSSIMIGIITYISVLERTKEIGILRAIGASKRDVVRVFRAETIIEGAFAGILGTVVAWLLCNIANLIVSGLAGVNNIVQFTVPQALILILVSILLTVIAGNNPARRASKKDPVEALRSE